MRLRGADAVNARAIEKWLAASGIAAPAETLHYDAVDLADFIESYGQGPAFTITRYARAGNSFTSRRRPVIWFGGAIAVLWVLAYVAVILRFRRMRHKAMARQSVSSA